LDAEPLDDAPIIDLRLRKGARRRGVKLAVATPRASALDPLAALSVRFEAGRGGAFASALRAALAGEEAAASLAREAGAEPQELLELASLLSDPGRGARQAGGDDGTPLEVVVVWGERLAAGPGGAAAARA